LLEAISIMKKVTQNIDRHEKKVLSLRHFSKSGKELGS